jgi:hypothetical protein
MIQRMNKDTIIIKKRRKERMIGKIIAENGNNSHQ